MNTHFRWMLLGLILTVVMNVSARAENPQLAVDKDVVLLWLDEVHFSPPEAPASTKITVQVKLNAGGKLKALTPQSGGLTFTIAKNHYADPYRVFALAAADAAAFLKGTAVLVASVVGPKGEIIATDRITPALAKNVSNSRIRSGTVDVGLLNRREFAKFTLTLIPEMFADATDLNDIPRKSRIVPLRPLTLPVLDRFHYEVSGYRNEWHTGIPFEKIEETSMITLSALVPSRMGEPGTITLERLESFEIWDSTGAFGPRMVSNYSPKVKRIGDELGIIVTGYFPPGVSVTMREWKKAIGYDFVIVPELGR